MPNITSNHPTSPEESIPAFDLSLVPTDPSDAIPQSELLPAPIPNPLLPNVVLPRVVLGCAPFGYGVYADVDVRSTMPVRIVRAALRAGVRAFDTAPHYHPSEIILGHALAALKDEFPRSSYTLITKAGKYGPKVDDHDYAPEIIRASVERSLKRLQTDYLDVVYLHDCEFVAHTPPAQGTHLDALGASAAAYHLSDLGTTTSLGAGDDAVVAALEALRDLQAEGKIRAAGLAGYPLPTLLRLSALILARTGKPVDVVQSYAHQTLQCSTLGDGYVSALEKAGVRQVVNAAPLSMGILTAGGGPAWHPAKAILSVYGATREAVELAKERGSTIEEVAIAFGYRDLRQSNGAVVPVVVGCTDLEQLHATLRAYADVNVEKREDTAGEKERREKRDRIEEEVIALFKERGVHNVSWQSPAPDHY